MNQAHLARRGRARNVVPFATTDDMWSDIERRIARGRPLCDPGPVEIVVIRILDELRGVAAVRRGPLNRALTADDVRSWLGVNRKRIRADRRREIPQWRNEMGEGTDINDDVLFEIALSCEEFDDYFPAPGEVLYDGDLDEAAIDAAVRTTILRWKQQHEARR